MQRRPFIVPEALAHLRGEPRGREWLDRLPSVVAECGERWSLRIGEPFPYAFVSVAIAVSRADGTPAVLKIQFPHRESEHEADALATWNGDGAVRLLEHDPERNALLLERSVPGTPLATLEPDQALDVAVELLPRLWKPVEAPFRPLAEEAAWWASYLEDAWERAGRPFERRLVDAALDALAILPGTQGEQVLVNQDLHAQNILRAEREPWLVIDPKPLAGEREFGVAPLVRGGELRHSRAAVVHRLDRLTTELKLNRERARGWALAQTVAWSFQGDGALPHHIDVARWLLDDA